MLVAMNSERVKLSPDKDEKKMGNLHLWLQVTSTPSPFFLIWQQNREGKHLEDLVPKIIAPIRISWDTADICWGSVSVPV